MLWGNYVENIFLNPGFQRWGECWAWGVATQGYCLLERRQELFAVGTLAEVRPYFTTYGAGGLAINIFRKMLE